MSISFQDVYPYPKAEWQNGVFIGRRLVQVEPADAAAFLDAIDTVPNNLWPFTNMGTAEAVLTSIESEARGGAVLDGALSGGNPNAMMSFQKLLFLLTYTNDKVRVLSNRLIWEEINPGVKPIMMSYPEQFHLTWSDGRDVIGQPLNVYQGTMNYTLVQYRILQIPPQALLWPGSTNSTNFYLRVHAPLYFRPGTLLYLGARIVPQSSAGLQSRRTLYHQFASHPVNWNYFYRPETAQYEPILLPTSQPWLPHPQVDLNLLVV